MNTNFILFLLIVALIVFIIVKVIHKFKFLRLDNVVIVNGGVKCGKTTLSVYLALKTYKKNLLRYKVRVFFQKIFRLKIDEKPLLYSNIPLKVDYVPFNYDLLLRNHRFTYKSVCLLSESSLVCGSMDFKDDDVNEKLTLFVKLFGHETKGGSLFIETQSLNDNHFAFKRGINRYLWIETLNKKIPFFLVYRLREMAYSDGDSSISNIFNEDIDETLKLCVVSKRIWKKFDCYCYSSLTDNLIVDDNIVNGKELKDLKSNDIIRLKNYKKEIKKNDK